MVERAIQFFVLLAVAVMAVNSNEKTRETPAPVYEHEPKDRVEGVYIVKLEHSCDEACFNDIIERFTDRAKRDGFPVTVTHRMASSMKMFTAKMSREAVELLRWMDKVDFIEEDQIVSIDDGEGMGVGGMGI